VGSNAKTEGGEIWLTQVCLQIPIVESYSSSFFVFVNEMINEKFKSDKNFNVNPFSMFFSRVTRFFLVQHTKNGELYTKWP
jgi:hypothetical protein